MALVQTRLILLILLVLQVQIVTTFSLRHSDVQNEPARLFKTRNLQEIAEDEHGFSLSMDFDAFDSDVQAALTEKEDWAGEGTEDKVTAVKETFGKITNYLNTFFTIKFKKELKFPEFKCAGNKYKFDAKDVKDVDYYLKVILQNNDGDPGTIRVQNCLVEESNSRAVVGLAFVNLVSVNPQQPFRRQLFRRFLHEVFHLMGFSKYTFENSPLEDGTTGSILTEIDLGGKKTSTLSATPMKELVKSAFKCDDNDGVPLNSAIVDVDDLNHLNFLVFPSELMNPDPTNDPPITEFSLAPLKYTGWYQIADNATESYDWNSELSCDSIKSFQNGCPTGGLSCSPDDVGTISCSSDSQQKLRCSSHPYFGYPAAGVQCASLVKRMEFCTEESTHEDWDDKIETIGADSKCFSVKNSDLTTSSRCLKVECLTTTDPNTQVVTADKYLLHLSNGETLECPQGSQTSTPSISGHVVTCYEYTKVCPSPNPNPEDPPSCPLWCTKGGYGLCLSDKTCFCFFGTSENGDSCIDQMPEEVSSSSVASLVSLGRWCSVLAFFLATFWT